MLGRARDADLPAPREALILDTLPAARSLLAGRGLPSHKLGALVRHFTGADMEGAHRAMADVDYTHLVLRELLVVAGVEGAPAPAQRAARCAAACEHGGTCGAGMLFLAFGR